MRLSAYIAKKYAISRRFAKTLIAEGKVYTEERVLYKDIEITHGDYFADIAPAEITYTIEDYLLKKCDDILFFYKPPLMHTERHTPRDPVCLSDILESFTGYSLLSRLDYGVDGVIPAGGEDLQIHSQQKIYLAWVSGSFKRVGASYWDVDADKRKKVEAFESQRGILMDFKVLKAIQNRSLIEVTVEKVHRHQVRAVCAHMGHPIIGDDLYGHGEDIGRILLHCYRATVNGISCESPNHEDFRRG